MDRPVVLYSYNRPKYFEQAVNSIKSQLGDREIFLFQDGPKNSEDKTRNTGKTLSHTIK